MTSNRRDFVRGAAAALGGAAWLPLHERLRPLAHRSTAPADQLERVGLQLYTVRTLMQQSVERTLQQVAAVGYREVEIAGYFGRSPAALSATMRQHGLSAPSAHVGIADIRGGEWAKMVEVAVQLGHRWLVCAWIPDSDRKSADAYKAVGDSLVAAAEVATKAGISVGYHNHDFELAPLGTSCGLDVLLEHTKGTRIAFEMDLYWLIKAGGDPLAYFDRWPGRFPLVHVKDSMGPPAHQMVDVGKGRIDFAKIFAKIFAQRTRAGTQHFYVEHDQPADPLQSIAASAAYLRTLNF